MEFIANFKSNPFLHEYRVWEIYTYYYQNF